MLEEKYMNIAIKESLKSLKFDDVPVGAIIVQGNRIIAKGYNKREKNKQVTQHAEIVAIEKACKLNKSWRLDDCVLYVTMEPCLMCSGAIIQSRIKKVVYGVNNEKFGFFEGNTNIFDLKTHNHKVEVVSGICQNEIQPILKNFFKQKRK